MKSVISPKEMKTIDQDTIASEKYSGYELMGNAGQALYDFFKFKFDEEISVLILCGTGNNGGDGFVLATYLLQSNYNVHVCLLGQTENINGDAKSYFNQLNSLFPKCFIDKSKISSFSFHVIVDAVFGTGFRGDFDLSTETVFEYINSLEAIKLAIDIPSGLNGFTGIASSHTFTADYTVTFGAAKYGLLINDGPNYSGEIIIRNIGFESTVFDNVIPKSKISNLLHIQHCFPQRNETGYKHQFGKILIIGGSLGMSGSVILTAKAALRSGAGLVKIATPENCVPIVESASLEAMTISLPETNGIIDDSAIDILEDDIAWADCIIVGMGLGVNPKYKSWLVELVNQKKPIILDADALKILKISDLSEELNHVIITPHLGEFATFISKDITQVRSNLMNAYVDTLENFNLTCLLKGKYTMIGYESLIYFNSTGNNGMATAGSGDVLSGIIGAMIGQGVDNLLDAGTIAAYLHGLAGDKAAAEKTVYGVIASDIIDYLPHAIKEIIRHDESIS